MSEQRRHAQWFVGKCGYGKKDKRRTARRARYFLRREARMAVGGGKTDAHE